MKTSRINALAALVKYSIEACECSAIVFTSGYPLNVRYESKAADTLVQNELCHLESLIDRNLRTSLFLKANLNKIIIPITIVFVEVETPAGIT